MNEELFKKVNDKIIAKFPEAIEASDITYDFPAFTIKKDNIHEVLEFLKNDEELNFHCLTEWNNCKTPLMNWN